MTRAASKTPIEEALAASVFPAMKINITQSSSVFRDMPDVRDVKTGAPNVTPRAYMETVSPAVVTGICRS